MKSFIFTCAFLANLSLYAQYGEFSFHYRYGVSTDNFKPVHSEIDAQRYLRVRTLNDQGMIFTYSYPVWKRFKINAHVGFEIAETKRYIPLIDYSYRLQLKNLPLNNNRASYRFGVTKGFELYDKKVKIELGFTFAKRNYLKNNIVYANETYESTEKYEWIDYKYVLTTKYDERYNNVIPVLGPVLINTEYSLGFKFKVLENLYLNLNFAYSRNYFVLFDLESDIRYYIGGSATPTYTIHQYGLLYGEDKFFGKNDHFLYTGIGVNYDFNFKKKEESSKL